MDPLPASSVETRSGRVNPFNAHLQQTTVFRETSLRPRPNPLITTHVRTPIHKSSQRITAATQANSEQHNSERLETGINSLVNFDLECIIVSEHARTPIELLFSFPVCAMRLVSKSLPVQSLTEVEKKRLVHYGCRCVAHIHSFSSPPFDTHT